MRNNRSTIVGDTACPSCRETGGDSTGNHLILFDDGGAYCNRCEHVASWHVDESGETTVAEPTTSDTSKAYEQDDSYMIRKMEDVVSLPTMGIPARNISIDTTQVYGVKMSVSPTDRSIQDIFFPEYKKGELTGYKIRLPDKKFSAVGDTKDCDFFGIDTARKALSNLPKNSRTLYVTEGEIDCLSVYQALCSMSTNANAFPAVVSLPAGAKHAAKSMSQNIEFINQFTKVVLCFDKDGPGLDATAEAARVIGSKAYEWGDVGGFKDANDILLAGQDSKIKDAVVLNCIQYMPAGIATIDDLMAEVLKKPTYGISYPWPTLTDATFGLRRGLLIGIGAGVGIGKTDWFSQLSAHLMHEHDEAVGLFKLEEQPARSIKTIAGKIAKTPFHRPDLPYDEELLIATIETLRGKVYAYNHFGFKGWSDIKRDIRTLSGYGVGYFIIDPLTALVAQEENEYKALNSMMEEMAALTQELNVTIFYSSHLNIPTKGLSHEEGGDVKEAQFTGSRAMIRWSHFIFGISRNKNALDGSGEPDLEVRNTSYFQMLKDREHGRTCRFPIQYNSETTEYLEPVSSSEDF
jgi:twinkle protein